MYTHALQIREATREQFRGMTLHQFSSLFKAFKIYSSKDVTDFLKLYTFSSGLRICDDTCRMFINDVVERFSGAKNHFFLMILLESAGEAYSQQKRPLNFITDLLHLKTPKLFSLTEDTDGEGEDYNLQVFREFTRFLTKYISRNSIKEFLLNEILNDKVVACYILRIARFEINFNAGSISGESPPRS